MLRPSIARLLGLLVAVLFVLPLSTARAAIPAKNLLQNPGFEEGIPGHPWMPTAWDTSRAGLQTVFFGRDTFLVHSGTYAVSVANVSALWPMAHNWSQSLLIQKQWVGKDAVFSLWTRSNGVLGRGYLLLQAYRDTASKMGKVWGVERDTAQWRLNIKRIDDPLLDLGWKRQFFSDVETEWVHREVRIFIPPSANMLFLRCGLVGTGQVIFDDASLTIEPAQPPAPLPLHTNLLRDPGFEGTGDDWEYSLPPYEGMRAVLDTTTAHSGRASVMFTGGENGWVQARAGVCQVLGNRGLQGKRVRLSGWVKTDSLRSLAYLKIYCHTVHGAEQSDPGEAFSMNTAWTKTSIEMNVPPDTYEVWGWFMYNAPMPGHVYFDDTSFEVLGPAVEPKRGGGKASP